MKFGTFWLHSSQPVACLKSEKKNESGEEEWSRWQDLKYHEDIHVKSLKRDSVQN